MKDFIGRIFKDDKENQDKDKKRKQHPHIVKSKKHWGWDAGYENYDSEQDNNNKK